MRAEELKGHLEGMLLSVLDPTPLHGYGVVEALRRRSGGHVVLPSGTIYPALHRLEHAGLVASSWSEVGGRSRRVYVLTPAGRRALADHRTAWDRIAAAVSSVMERPEPST